MKTAAWFLVLAACAADSVASQIVETRPEQPGGICVYGGVVVRVGTDDSGDAVLQDAEVELTKYVCDHVIVAPTLIEVSAEPRGANCTYGGKAIRVGIDTNVNGVLDPVEAGAPAYMCDADGAPYVVSIVSEPAGTHCGAGGVAILSGPDENANGDLDASEVVATTYVCNPTT